jgi:phage repressor protein C with HTH and peptisase S24 domain
MSPDALIAALKSARVPHAAIAEAIGRNRVAATNMLNGKRKIAAHEMPALVALLGPCGNAREPDDSYSPAAMVAAKLDGNPDDFTIWRVTGDDMLPVLSPGDTVMIDRRVSRATEAGTYLVRLGEIEAIRNVEPKRDGWRVFAQNPRYSEELVPPGELEIVGKPVWYGRFM